MNNSETQTFTLDDTAGYYPQLADLLTSVAASHCDVAIDQTTHMRWRDIMGLMRDVDTNADAGLDRSIITDQLATFDQLSEHYPSLNPESLGPKTHQALQHRALHILRIGSLISLQDTLRRYTLLRGSEARHTAYLFSDSATDAVQQQPAFKHSFMPLLERMAISATLLDSVVDAGKDFAGGKITLQLRSIDRLKILGLASREAIPVIPAAAHISVLGQLSISAFLHMKRHLLYGRAK